MASTSEVTYGSRVANAEKISTHLKSFTGFVAPTTDTTIVNYDSLITVMKTGNSTVATGKTSYSKAVDIRKKHFTKEDDSVSKLLSLIISAAQSKLGKKAKEVQDLKSLVAKIRGIKPKKLKKTTTPTPALEETVSQSVRSYGSITQTFADIVAGLVALGTNYAPVRAEIKLPALQAKLVEITAANNAVTTTFGALKKAVDNRLEMYANLSERTQRIKDAVKSQYGLKSTEYKLIKGLRV
jgi:hypothetical protein